MSTGTVLVCTIVTHYRSYHTLTHYVAKNIGIEKWIQFAQETRGNMV